MKLVRTAFCAALVVLAASGSHPARAQVPWRFDFEGPEPSWRDAGGDARYLIQSHQRVQQGAHGGRWCEYLDVRGENGSTVYLKHQVPRAHVIEELACSAWIKADRPGIQIFLRVILPRNKDPRTGAPLSALLGGSGYTQVGSWQQLRVDNIPLQLERQARVLRAQFGPSVDARGALIDGVVLNVYGGPGLTHVWIDDLELTGAVGSTEPSRPSVMAASNPTAQAEPQRLPPVASTVVNPAPAETIAAEATFSGTTITVAGRPIFPRIVEHRGESLATLQSLGFTAVRCDGFAPPQVLEEARRLGMWIIAAPPPTSELEAQGAAQKPQIGTELDRVLAWDLGRGLSRRELETNKHRAKLVRAADPRGRPLMVEAESDLRAYSRHADLLLVRRAPLGTSLELADYLAHLRSRPQLARPGTPVWASVQTQLARQLLEQFAAASGGSVPAVSVQPAQIRLLAHMALAAGVRAICFESATPLDAPDPETKLRAAVLEMLNLELDLIEPWAAAGSFLTVAESSDPHVFGAVLQVDRARLLLPIGTAPHSQLAVGSAASSGISFVVPGVPESTAVMELSPSGVRRLTHKRVTGGTRITLAPGERDSLIVMSEDASITGKLTKRLQRVRQRAAQLERDIAGHQLHLVEQTERQLAAQGRVLPATRDLLAAARADVRQFDATLGTADERAAFNQVRHAGQLLREIERVHLDKALETVGSVAASPFVLSFATLPQHYQLVRFQSSVQRGPNRLAGGDFEDLQFVTQSGWRHFQHPQAEIATSVELSPDKPHTGRLALRLQASPTKKDERPGAIETPPLWITSPPVDVALGQWVEIRCWVRIPESIAGSVDGLLIIDSLTGDALAERVKKTDGWKELVLQRVATRSSPMTVTFALSGLGQAWIDDVTIHPRAAAEVGRLDQAQRVIRTPGYSQ